MLQFNRARSSGRGAHVGVPPIVTPSGALAIWNIADYANVAGGPVIANTASGVPAPTGGWIQTPNNQFGNVNIFGVGGTITGSYATGVDGATGGATRWLATNSSSAVAGPIQVLTAGAKTGVVYVKSNTGSNQDVRIKFAFAAVTSSAQTVNPTTWTAVFFTRTFTSGNEQMQLIGDGTNTPDVQIGYFQLVDGSSVPAFEAPAGHIYLGQGDNYRGTYSAGELDATACLGWIQFPSTTFTDWTFCATFKKTGAGTTYHGPLGAVVTNTGAAAAGSLGCILEYAQKAPSIGVVGVQNYFQQNALAGMFDWQAYGGYHQATWKYDATAQTITFAIDDVIMNITENITGSAQTIKDFNFNTFNGASLISTFKYVGKAGFWNRALTSAEIQDFYEVSKAAALAAGITLTPVTNVIVCDGDSNTVGNAVNGWPYAMWSSITTPAIGCNNARNGSTLGTISARIAKMGTSLPPASRRGSRKFVFVINDGTNDLGTGQVYVSNLSGWFADYATLTDSLRAMGWKVVVTTNTDKTDAPARANFATVASTLNSSWVGVHADAIADLHADANIGASGASASTTYFVGDGLHLNQTGEDTAGGIIAPVVNAL